MEEKSELSSRQWWLYRLIKSCSENDERLSIPQIIEYQSKYQEQGKLPYRDLYQFKETQGNHSNCPAIYEDKDIINESDELDKIICVKNNQFYLGTESEMIEYHNKLYHNVCRYSHKCKIIRDKISQEGQGKLFTYDLVEIQKSKGREYHDTFMKQETLNKENQKLKDTIQEYKELIKAYKNEAQMWKERALQR